MSNKHLIEAVPGRVEIQHVDTENEDDLIVETKWDVEPIVERAKMLSEQTPGETFRHVGTIPPHVLRQAYREGWIHDQKKWKQWLNDPDNAAFRTWPGQI
jgi:hypothetical protein